MKTMLALLLILSSGSALAGPVEIESGKMTFFHKTSQAEFIGKVQLTRDDFQLHCDKLIAYYKNNQLDHAEAFGNIKLKQGKITGSSNKAVLDQVKGKLTLIGNASLQQQGSRIQGETIIHYINQEKTIVQPKAGGRTHMVIESDQNGSTPMSGGSKK
ncbi:lipopolysaccharide export system protein LptA [Mariprofundus micogutta]|uniref:Lipopolysaccharide export system protein LptA n=1 Tax=Mariprofundus micogutta TaxID=1921010 RepID=A0A1L8CN77_9PROT|nr:lipopolysaccharide transport periplasmic protein LptA [Mariprofundus micogutta]GAV20366.1 lipopolysaccharide export system protein LptA [Mariprofundus micogutta]